MANTGSYNPQQAAQAGLGWVPQNNPNFGKPGFIGYGDSSSGDSSSGTGIASAGSTTSSDPYNAGGSLGIIKSSDPATPATNAPAGSAPGIPAGGAMPSGTQAPSTGTGVAQTAGPAGTITASGTSGGAAAGGLPASAPQGTPQQPPAGSVDPFGGTGVYLGGGQWVPANSPYAKGYTTPNGAGTTPVPTGSGAPASPADPAGTGAPAATPSGGTSAGGAAANNGAPGQANNPNPTAPDTGNTGNTGTQDTLRNALLNVLNENPTVDVNDPTVQAQLIPYEAARSRQQDQEINQGAEGAFANQQDFGQPEKEAAAERAGADVANETGGLIGTQQAARTQQLQTAAGQLQQMINEDQQNANTQAATAQAGQLGNRELDIRDELGKLGISAQQIDALMSDQEFMASLGLTAGADAASLNNTAAQAALG